MGAQCTTDSEESRLSLTHAMGDAESILITAGRVLLAIILWFVFSSLVKNMQRPSIRLYDLACVSLLTTFWLGPVIYSGVTHQMLPELKAFRRQIFMTDLFSYSIPSWAAYYVQVRRANDDSWEELPLQQYFHMSTFGKLTRLNLYFIGGHLSKEQFEVRQHALLRWLIDQLQGRDVAQPPIAQIRLLVFDEFPDQNSPPKSPYQKPQLSTLPPDKVQVLLTLDIPR